MRTFLACFVLAAAVATPGIVVAATSSDGHSAASFNVAEGPVGVASASSSSTYATPSDPHL